MIRYPHVDEGRRRAPAVAWSATLAAAITAAITTAAGACDRWLARRQRVAQDRAVLRAMSDRELADIGVPRASVDPAAGGVWARADFR